MEEEIIEVVQNIASVVLREGSGPTTVPKALVFVGGKLSLHLHCKHHYILLSYCACLCFGNLQLQM